MHPKQLDVLSAKAVNVRTRERERERERVFTDLYRYSHDCIIYLLIKCYGQS